MAKARTTGDNLEQLRAENERLRAENARLQQAPAPKGRRPIRILRTIGIVLCTALAVVLLVVGNLLFWTGNTIVKNDRFNATVAPIIQNTATQKAIASYTTTQLYDNVDVASHIQNALPPRAAFLAPTIAGQLRGYTQTTLDKILARPKFQDRWNQALFKTHAKFINTVKQSGGDGVIDLNDLYQQLSGSLKGTKLSFLADKKLPSKVGDVQVASGDRIKVLHNVIVHINTWRLLSVILFVVFAGLAIYLSRRRRRMLVLLGIYCVAGLFVTLIALRVTREIIAGKVMPAYTDAVRQTAQIVFHPLVVQTATLLIAFLLVVFVAWLSGSTRSATYVQSRVRLLLAGKLHYAIFGEHENAVTRWIGTHKRYLEWGVVIIIAILMLLTRLTLTTLVVYILVTIVAILLIELLGAPDKSSTYRADDIAP